MGIRSRLPILSLLVLTSCVFSPTREYNARFNDYDSQPVECGKAENEKGPAREIQPVAQQFYREHLWYRVYTRPGEYFHWLKHNCMRLKTEKQKKEGITVLAIGDSWFAYPKEFAFFDFLFGGRSNLLTGLDGIERAPRLYTLSLSNSGEVVANMAGIAEEDPIDIVESMQKDVRIPWVIIQSLAEARRIGLPFDYVLISGGGNDILAAGRLKALFNHRVCAEVDVLKCIDQDKLEQSVRRLGKAYQRLIDLIASQPDYQDVKVITHTYDLMMPMPVGANFFGKLVSVGEYGWVYPHFETYGVNKDQGVVLVAHIMKMLKEKLLWLQENNRNHFIVVDTQGTLNEVVASNHCLEVWDWGRMKHVPCTSRDLWLNEIHPTSEGFGYLAEKIHRKIVEDMRWAR